MAIPARVLRTISGDRDARPFQLNTEEATVIGGLYRLWSIADSHSVDGILPGLTVDTLDRKADILGFAVALAEVGWLAVEGGRGTIPDFSVRNGQSTKSRAQGAIHQQRCRGSAAQTNRDSRANDVMARSVMELAGVPADHADHCRSIPALRQKLLKQLSRSEATKNSVVK